ncbi:hypothetical protein [Halovivax cerinus]|uniref:Uncharacterized protein n=1 Tax=Halovivax cerinus TaxID=1487865 RepID=A0ABD5NJP7_9EURY|nr:hypothetical protein [Halovivax cerinus]
MQRAGERTLERVRDGNVRENEGTENDTVDSAETRSVRETDPVR